MKNTLKINHAERTITMDRTFAKNAENTMSAEYSHLQSVRRDYPTYTVVRRQIKKNPNKECYKKGMKKYPKGIREAVVARIQAGESQNKLSKAYGISRYAIQSWLKEPAVPKQRGMKPAKTIAEYKYENKRLKMENELLRDFLQSTERK